MNPVIILFKNICGCGFKIVINSTWSDKFMFELLLHIPKKMIIVDTLNTAHGKFRIIIDTLNTDRWGFRLIGPTNNTENSLIFGIQNTTCRLRSYLATSTETTIINWGFPHHYLRNQRLIEKIVHYAYTTYQETPSSIQLDSYKKKMWNIMYDDCIGTKGMLYILIFNKYLLSDITKKIINTLLIGARWSNLGFCF